MAWLKIIGCAAIGGAVALAGGAAFNRLALWEARGWVW